MKRKHCPALPRLHSVLSAWFVIATLLAAPGHAATNFILFGWSEAGMQFVDNDFSVFAINPPGNTIRAQIVQLIDGNQARLLTNPAAATITVTYEAVGDGDGSTNSTSNGKSNFWDYDVPLYGTNLNVDEGLGGWMPGAGNTPRQMTFDTNYNCFVQAGIPITPYDDRGKFNPYPLFKLVARVGGIPVTNVDVVLGVTDEMDCRLCHASGSPTAAAPAAGWVFERNPERDFRLNILRLHDERQLTNAVYTAALSSAGYNAGGLYAHVKSSSQPVRCSKCHFSSVVPGSGYGSIKPLTRAIHTHHATVIDPRDGQPLDSETNRATCYTCHGGSLTHFLRGAMGTADTTSGQLAIQCQSCHGSMAIVGSTNRTGWLSQPNCQACHVGDAQNTINGQIRFTSALTNGQLRAPANDRFATDPNTPGNGFSLFHSSRGHGNLMCSACHGAPHAEYPSAVSNDNRQSIQVQGHVGVMAECQVCHGTQTLTAGNGPHGMHPHDELWADGSTFIHPDAWSESACAPCHGTQTELNKQGTVLSLARGARVYSTALGTKRFWQGQKIGCTQCHNAPSLPTAGNSATSTVSGVAVTFTLTSSTNSVRIVTQPAHGLVGLSNKVATYRPEPGFVGTDVFTFASAKPQLESVLATGTVVVSEMFSVADGIPDWWRQLYFGGTGTTTNSLSCASCDPDGDGQSNAQEYNANTDPNDALSRLSVFGAQVTGSAVRVQFQSVVTRRYAIDVAAEPGSTTWTTLGSNVWGRNTTAEITATNGATLDRAAFRVRTQ